MTFRRPFVNSTSRRPSAKMRSVRPSSIRASWTSWVGDASTPSFALLTGPTTDASSPPWPTPASVPASGGPPRSPSRRPPPGPGRRASLPALFGLLLGAADAGPRAPGVSTGLPAALALAAPELRPAAFIPMAGGVPVMSACRMKFCTASCPAGVASTKRAEALGVEDPRPRAAAAEALRRGASAVPRCCACCASWLARRTSSCSS
mmetsp:Transcript_115235/g.367668  ORF Transcript_115235/g.367668 Transcript_115235/m.367668 type:complete len:206 (-) Transcript_115235:402-1019(-)